MRFQNVGGAVDEAFQEILEGVKWKLWHGKSDKILQKLKLLMTNITDSKTRSKLQKLHNYLANNPAYLLNYEERDQQALSYTSQVA